MRGALDATVMRMEWQELLVASSVSFVLGIVASASAWWIITFRLRPVLEVSTELAKTPDANAPTGYIYRFKLRNPSSRRYVADVRTDLRLRIEGLNPSRPGNSWLLVLPAGSGTAFPAMAPLAERTFRLHPEQLHGAALDRLPADVRTKIDDGSVDLEELLALERGRASILLAVGASHEFSGLRRLFPRVYEAESIRLGKFERQSVDVVPLEDGDAYVTTVGKAVDRGDGVAAGESSLT